jgi:hypothetical protein
VGRTEQATVSGGAGTRSPRARRRMYVSVTVKFLVAQGLSARLARRLHLAVAAVAAGPPATAAPGPMSPVRTTRAPSRCSSSTTARPTGPGPLPRRSVPPPASRSAASASRALARATPWQEPRPQHRPGGGPDRAGHHPRRRHRAAPRAVRQLVARLLCAPADVQAVAGSVLVRNSRDNLWTRMQEWDYSSGSPR